MNKQLRKRHRISWVLIGLSLPVMMLISWLFIPQLEPVKAITMDLPEAFPISIKKIEHPAYTVQLRKNSAGEMQLEWRNEAPLKVPTAVIYQLNEGNSKQLIGRIETRGIYRFTIQPDSSSNNTYRFQLYDFIHQQIIDTLNFHL
ncbi:hypothetical protein [Lacibacter sediminis]|uniref:Uncharacterized protein n=1 Tax=Lacibacter sediminis TaxID=2760713 RepID=A0A7G5XDD6_9BACT|nr:hypothetical protein [Lacibacter sediminis]QNA43489.1 hypothetical protein H4075_15570 [Lacibacter sediminis]